MKELWIPIGSFVAILVGIALFLWGAKLGAEGERSKKASAWEALQQAQRQYAEASKP